MARILINGLNAKTGGGKSILNNYLSLLKNSPSEHRFYVLTPDEYEYEKYACSLIRIVKVPKNFKDSLLFPLLYLFILPKLMNSYKIDLIFNLGDVPLPSRIPQLYLFDWPYAVYPSSIVWKMMDIRSWFSRQVKLVVFKKWIKYATTVIAQTDTMKNRLEILYDLDAVTTIPNAVSLENMHGGEPRNFDLPNDKKKLLYLTYYYSHKNLEVFIPLAKRIKEMGLPYCFIVTLDASQHRKASEFLDNIRKEGLENFIINVGAVPMTNVPSLYAQCDALLMPTLLETFGLPYIEAMYHQKTILTSDIDFARDVCGNAAFYFDPLNPGSILSAITFAFENDEEKRSNIEHGLLKLNNLLTWEQVFDNYQMLLDGLLIPQNNINKRCFK